MTKFINVVKVKLKKDSKKNYIKKIKNITNFDGLISTKHIAIDSNTYCIIEEWSSKEALMKARKSIELINKIKPLIDEKSSQIDIISSLGGTVITERNINKNEIKEQDSASYNINKSGSNYFYFLYKNS